MPGELYDPNQGMAQALMPIQSDSGPNYNFADGASSAGAQNSWSPPSPDLSPLQGNILAQGQQGWANQAQASSQDQSAGSPQFDPTQTGNFNPSNTRYMSPQTLDWFQSGGNSGVSPTNPNDTGSVDWMMNFNQWNSNRPAIDAFQRLRAQHDAQAAQNNTGQPMGEGAGSHGGSAFPDSGIPLNWMNRQSHDTSSNGGFWDLQNYDLGAQQDPFTAGPSTNNSRLLPAPFNRPGFVMRGGSIIQTSPGAIAAWMNKPPPVTHPIPTVHGIFGGITPYVWASAPFSGAIGYKGWPSQWAPASVGSAGTT